MSTLSGSSHETENSRPPMTIVVRPDGGQAIHAFGDVAQIKISGEQTNGSMVVALCSSSPGGGPPPHRHHREDETFLVLEGEVRFLANGEWTEPLGPGSIVYTPRGVVHTFQNVGDKTSRQLVIATPSGFERFFSQCAEVFAAAGEGRAPELARLVAISDQFGIEFVPPLRAPQS